MNDTFPKNVVDDIEDIIVKYIGTSNLAPKLKEYAISNNLVDSTGKFKESLLPTPPFSDVKLVTVISEIVKGDSSNIGYINSLDFSESQLSNELADKFNKEDETFSKNICGALFVTDWANHQHQMVGTAPVEYESVESIQDTRMLSDLVNLMSKERTFVKGEDFSIFDRMVTPGGTSYASLRWMKRNLGSNTQNLVNLLKESRNLKPEGFSDKSDDALKLSIAKLSQENEFINNSFIPKSKDKEIPKGPATYSAPKTQGGGK